MIVGCGMFGYVRVYQPELKMGEFEQYRGVYCSLCKSLGKRYGFFARMTLSYDFTFLAVFHMALQKGCAGFRMGRCALNPLKKRMCCRENEEIAYAASLGVDVVVTDGFTGNVLLKGIEGSIKYMTRQLKGIFMKNFKTKLAALAIKDEFKALKASLDPNEVGGTAMLGISKPVIKAHGSSDARAIYNAIRQAISFVDSGIIDDITANISYMRVDKHAAKELD